MATASTIQEVVSNKDDIVNYLIVNKFSKFKFEDKMFIVNDVERPCPEMKQLVNHTKSCNRGFTVAWYTKFDWLTGSEVRNKLFCWYCLLFAEKEQNPWKTSGVDNLKNLYKSLPKHNISQDHTHAALKFKLFGKQNIQTAIDSAYRDNILKHNETVRGNRLILKRLIDMIIYLSTQEQALRGHDESESSVNQGNFKELAKFLCKYDETFKTFIDESSVFSGLSKTVQNELIESINKVLQDTITDEINNTSCFAWQVDETTDISCHSQLSVIFRYTNKGAVVERFMGFFNVSQGRRAEDLFNLLTDKFQKFDIQNKLIGQTYDGASVMSGELNGLQTKVKSVAPQALFTHCYAHNLNLVLQDTCSKIKQCKIFFASLTGFPTFFTKSTKRTQILDEVGSRRLPSSSDTRWNFKSRLVWTVLHHRNELIEVFDTILNSEEFQRDHITLRESEGFKKSLNDFTFVFLLETFDLIFQHTNLIFSILQSKFSDIVYCKNRIENLSTVLKNYRNDDQFNKIYKAANDITANQQPPLKRRRTDFDVADDISVSFKRLYFEILDLIINQIDIRFKHIEDLRFFDLLDKNKFHLYRRSFPYEILNLLLKMYPNFFDKVKLENELRVWYTDNDILGTSAKFSDIFQFIFSNNLSEDISQIAKLLSVVLSLPATSASVERSFSALKRIKTFARNSMSQSRLSNLSMIAIERNLVKTLQETSEFYDKIIDHYANKKNRRIELIYKRI